jgi:beta-N-acetylhexosaminidase
MTPDDVERLAAACLFPGFDGLRPPAWLEAWLARGLGGVVLFARNVGDRDQLRALNDELHAARPRLLVATDEEGGDVTRLEAATGSSYPGSLALGAVDDVALTERVAASLGGDVRSAGVDVDFAPVADVNTNPANPVIGVRSFGADPELAARHVAAFVAGLQVAGVAACAKHFPGHGDTHQDSHLELPTVDADERALRAALVPFAAAVDAGAQAVMSAHIRVPAVDDEPATLSRRLLDGVLRHELGFAGVVFTDALEMRAISDTVGMEAAAVAALASGADALVLGHDIGDAETRAVHGAIVAAVGDGRLSPPRLADAAARVDVLSAWVASRPRAAPVDQGVGVEAARRALAVDGDVALDAAPVVMQLDPEPGIAAGPARHSLAGLLRRRRPETQIHRVTAASGEPTALRDGRPLVVVARDAHRHGWQRAHVETWLRAAPDLVLVETGLPSWRPPAVRRYVATLGAGRANLEAAVERLLP